MNAIIAPQLIVGSASFAGLAALLFAGKSHKPNQIRLLLYPIRHSRRGSALLPLAKAAIAIRFACFFAPEIASGWPSSACGEPSARQQCWRFSIGLRRRNFQAESAVLGGNDRYVVDVHVAGAILTEQKPSMPISFGRYCFD